MKCIKCKSNLNSRNDLVISHWLVGSPILALYHKKCFEEVKSKIPGLLTPSIIDSNKLTSILAFNWVGLISMLLVVIYFIFGLKIIEDWDSFFNVGVTGYLFSIFALIGLAILFYFPIRNLRIIHDIKNLK